MSSTWLRPRRDDDRGAVALLVAAMLVVFLGLAAIVVDLGNARDVSRQAQNAADAGALAAANCMASLTSGCNYTAAATLSAQNYITANGWDGTGAVITFDLPHQTVSVSLPARQQPTFFAGALDQSVPAVARSAVATWNGAGTGCSLCVLGGVDLSANGDLKMDQGDLLVNGDLVMGPNTTVDDSGGLIFVNGRITGNSTGKPGIPPLQDMSGVLTPTGVPRAGVVTPPSVDLSPSLGLPVATAPSGACAPGTYPKLDGCNSFAPGVYVLTGATSFTRNVTLQATGVTFVLTCSSSASGVLLSAACPPGVSGGSIVIGGQAAVVISVSSPPLYVGVCFGLAVVSDPNNTGQLSVQGTQAQLSVDGSIYMRSGTLNYNGGPDLNVAGNIIVGKYTSSGNPGTLHALGCGPGRGAGGGGVHLLR